MENNVLNNILKKTKCEKKVSLQKIEQFFNER